jgi:hypothetical protein
MRSSTRLSLTMIFLASAAALGCSANVVAGPEADAESGPSSAGFVEVTRMSSGEGSRTVARFARVRGGAFGDGEMDLLRVGLVLPAIDACAPTSQSRGGSDAPSPRSVELADVGSLSVEAGGAATVLAARQMNVIDLVSGVVYWGEGPLPSRGRYELRASGRPELDVPPFVVSAQSPGEPQDVRLNGQPGDKVALAPGSVEVTWDPGAADDVVYIDVAARGQATTRCAFTDGGRATIPSSVLGSADEGTLAIHRVHRESFRVRGIDRGEIRFDLARVVAFSRR